MMCALSSRCGLLAAMAVFWVPQARAQALAEPAPIRVTSDSAEYCDALWRQARAEWHEREHVAVADQARQLGREGRQMCGEGHLRPGILRLRRALQMLRDE